MFNTRTTASNPVEQFKEIRIPVPWGYIAGKEYGTPDGHPVLALHGWQDNCGSFDPLIPLLPPDLHIVAIDFPGHGLSSHKPLGILYHVLDWMVDVHRIIEHLQWKECSFIGHSMGAVLALYYAGCYPERVVKVVVLDVVTVKLFPIETLPKRVTTGIVQLLNTEKPAAKIQRPVSREVAREVLVDIMEGTLTSAAATIMLKRGTASMGDAGKVVFSRDSRLSVIPIPGMTAVHAKSLAKQVRCEILMIWANQGLAYSNALKEDVDELINIYSKAAKYFKMVKVDGTHHVHLNNPTLVAPYIKEFLSS